MGGKIRYGTWTAVDGVQWNLHLYDCRDEAHTCHVTICSQASYVDPAVTLRSTKIGTEIGGGAFSSHATMGKGRFDELFLACALFFFFFLNI